MIIFAQVIFLLFLLASTFFYVFFMVKKELMYQNLMEIAVWIIIFVAEIADLKLLTFNFWNVSIVLVAIVFLFTKTINLIKKRDYFKGDDHDDFGDEVITNPDLE